jgi:hypothetical protein
LSYKSGDITHLEQSEEKAIMIPEKKKTASTLSDRGMPEREKKVCHKVWFI